MKPLTLALLKWPVVVLAGSAGVVAQHSFWMSVALYALALLAMDLWAKFLDKKGDR